MSTDLVAKLEDLIKQAATERSHYYVAATAGAAVIEIMRLRKLLEEQNERLLLMYEVLTGQHRSTWPAAVESGS